MSAPPPPSECCSHPERPGHRPTRSPTPSGALLTAASSPQPDACSGQPWGGGGPQRPTPSPGPCPQAPRQAGSSRCFPIRTRCQDMTTRPGGSRLRGKRPPHPHGAGGRPNLRRTSSPRLHPTTRSPQLSDGEGRPTGTLSMDREKARVPEAKCDPESSFPTGPVGRRRLTELLLCSGRTAGPIQPSLSSQPPARPALTPHSPQEGSPQPQAALGSLVPAHTSKWNSPSGRDLLPRPLTPWEGPLPVPPRGSDALGNDPCSCSSPHSGATEAGESERARRGALVQLEAAPTGPRPSGPRTEASSGPDTKHAALETRPTALGAQRHQYLGNAGPADHKGLTSLPARGLEKSASWSWACPSQAPAVLPPPRCLPPPAQLLSALGQVAQPGSGFIFLLFCWSQDKIRPFSQRK